MRAEERRNPEKAAAHALRWGVPILESSITLIADGKLYYRGHDVGELARTRSLEEVAALIWTRRVRRRRLRHAAARDRRRAASRDLPFINRAQSVLPLVAARDALAFDLRPRNVAQTGWRIVNLLTSVAAASQELEATVEETLAREWAPQKKDAAKVIRAALIVCADHELNVSAFTARCVASAGSNPYAVVARRPGRARRHEARRRDRARRRALARPAPRRATSARALAERLRRGETIDGFGHPLYPDGDPRAALLLDDAPEVDGAHLRPQARRKRRERPRRKAEPRLRARRASNARSTCRAAPPLALFAIGRTIGWIAHAIEQYAQDAMIRPRAKYVGPKP